jgi:hypothetical protein
VFFHAEIASASGQMPSPILSSSSPSAYRIDVLKIARAKEIEVCLKMKMYEKSAMVQIKNTT